MCFNIAAPITEIISRKSYTQAPLAHRIALKKLFVYFRSTEVSKILLTISKRISSFP